MHDPDITPVTGKTLQNLLGADDLPPIALADAVETLHALSHQPRPPSRVSLAGGGTGDAVELLGRFRARACRHFAGRDRETDAILARWARVESGLAGDLGRLVGLVDWVTRFRLLDAFRLREGLT
jgi:proteasome accessory factor A